MTSCFLHAKGEKHVINPGRNGRVHRPKALNPGGPSVRSSSTVGSLETPEPHSGTLSFIQQTLGVRGSYYMPSNVLGMENTQENYLDEVLAAGQIFLLLPCLLQLW